MFAFGKHIDNIVIILGFIFFLTPNLMLKNNNFIRILAFFGIPVFMNFIVYLIYDTMSSSQLNFKWRKCTASDLE